MDNFKYLFEPLRIGNLQIKNRIKLPALSMGYTRDFHVSERLKTYYKERARGGAGLIGVTCSATEVEPDAPFVGLFNDSYLQELRQLVGICHEYDSKIYAQVGVGYAWNFGKGPELVIPSEKPGDYHVPFRLGAPRDKTKPRILSEKDISDIVESFGDAAVRARESGFDAFEVAAGWGYVLSQFLSPLTNSRTDHYGGSFENRTRIFKEIIANIRKKVGHDFPLMARLTAQFTNGGYTLEEFKLFAKMLEEEGVNALCVGAGWHTDNVEMIQPWVPEGSWVYLAQEVKSMVKIPVATGTNIRDPFYAEEVIAQGKADQIYMARQLLADPDLPVKAQNGLINKIRPCIGCCRCFAQTIYDDPISCSVNPELGRTEKAGDLEPSGTVKKVFVIGGGPAGMTAAITLARRGHDITLFEQAEQLGGQLLVASVPPNKTLIDKFTQYLADEVKTSNIMLRLGQKFDWRVAAKEPPDDIVVATGAEPIIPAIQGVSNKNVVTAVKVLKDRLTPEGQVVIIGGGFIGCETAEYLARTGSKVTVLEAMSRIGNDIDPITRWGLLSRLKKMGVMLNTRVTATAIGISEILATDGEGKQLFFPADTVVLAVGMKSEQEVSRNIKYKEGEIHLIGDCDKPSRIAEAVHSAFGLAVTI